MTIKVETPNWFLGVVHARDFRRPACTSYGLGTSETPLNINMLAEKNSDDFCGVFINEVRMKIGRGKPVWSHNIAAVRFKIS